MIRVAALLAVVAAPSQAATPEACAALVARLPVVVARSDSVAGTCVLSDVRFGIGEASWRADRITLSGDVDAVPDAVPARLTGGLTGVVPDPGMPGRPGLDWLLREQAHPGFGVTFDATSEDGVLRVNALALRMDEGNEVTLTARVAGLPAVWPVDPVAAANIRLQALDLEIATDGLFEALFLLPLGRAVLDTTRDAEPQVANLRAAAAAFLDGFEGTGQAGNAEQLRGVLDALPHPRGNLEIGVGGAGIAAIQLLPFLTGTVSAEYLTRVGDAAALDVTWTPALP